MSIIQELSKPLPVPSYAKTLKKFQRKAVGDVVGVSSGYVSQILTGAKIPSPELDQKFRDLAAQVEAEERQQA